MCEFMQMIGNLNYMSVNANRKGQKRMCCPPALQLSRHLLLPQTINSFTCQMRSPVLKYSCCICCYHQKSSMHLN